MAEARKLTNKNARALPPATDKPYIVRDSELPGFFVIAGQSTRSFAFQIDVKSNGKRKSVRKTIGNVEDWSADSARAEARRHMAELRKQASETSIISRNEAVTFGQVWQHFERELETLVKAGKRSPRTREAYRDYATRILADWHNIPMRDLGRRPEIVEQRHRDITTEHGPYQGNRTAELVRRLYNHALRRRLDPSLPQRNPVIFAFNEESRRSTGLSPEQLPEWGAQLGRLSNPIRCEFHMFMLFSAMRPDALSKARWEHLDVKARALRVPEPKGGSRRAFDLPLSRPMQRSLWRARQGYRKIDWYAASKTPWIFPADTATGHIVEWREPRTKLSHWGADLRQTYRTIAAILAIDPLTTKVLMNHALGDVTDGYASIGAMRSHLIASQERISQFIVNALNPN